MSLLHFLPWLCLINRIYFFAGLDTGSITLVWVMAELVKNPQLMKKAQDPKLTKKAQEEIKNNVGNKRKVTRERHRITSIFENDSKRDTETTSTRTYSYSKRNNIPLQNRRHRFLPKNNGSSERLGNWTRPHILERPRRVPSKKI